MSPIAHLLGRTANAGETSSRLLSQWQNPGDVFSVLLVLGGDIVARAQAQLAGSYITPVAFSFGWVAYAISALVSIIGENRLMPPPDIPCKVINGRTGYIRDNTSWIIGRIVRDHEYWMHDQTRDSVKKIVADAWQSRRRKAEEKKNGSGRDVPEPVKAGLCVSIYRAGTAMPGFAGRDSLYYLGFVVTIFQLGVASIPCGLYGDYGILVITGSGIVLSLATGALRQWGREKWTGRTCTDKTVVLTRGNGSQHAVVVIGNGKGLDLEDLASQTSAREDSTPVSASFLMIGLAALWILLLITAAGLQEDTWYLLAVGCSGSVHNIYVVASRRSPEAFGIPLEFERVIARPKVMDTLLAVEDAYPHLGRSMRDTFFPGDLRPSEEHEWAGMEMRNANAS